MSSDVAGSSIVAGVVSARGGVSAHRGNGVLGVRAALAMTGWWKYAAAFLVFVIVWMMGSWR
jgi:hypothetical protein